MGEVLHLGTARRGLGALQLRSVPFLLYSVPNVTAHPSTASVPITVLLCNSPLLCSFNVGIKGLRIKTVDTTVVQSGDASVAKFNYML